MMTRQDFNFLLSRTRLRQCDVATALGVHPGTLNRVLRIHAAGLPVRYERPIRLLFASYGVEVPNTLPDGSVAVPTPPEPHYTRCHPPPGHYWSAKFKAFVELKHMPYANRVKNRLAQRRRGEPVTY